MIRSMLILAASIAAATPVLADTVTISAILANPTSYDGKKVTVSGAITDVIKKISAKGNAYETFSICDGGCIHVFTFGTPTKVIEGKTVDVTGTYSAVKHEGQYTFRNEIDADDGSL